MNPTKPNIVAIYVRVSTEDQNYDMQLTDLRDYALRSGWTIVEYTDTISGAKNKRPGLDRLMEDARLKKIDIVLVWKIDRFGRSLRDFLNNLFQLDAWGVRFIAMTQAIDTDKRNPAGVLLMHILAAVAQFERGIIQERVKSGVKEYQKEYAAGRVGKSRHSKSGKNLPIGRPRRMFRRDEVERMRKEGVSWRAIAKELGVAHSTIREQMKLEPRDF